MKALVVDDDIVARMALTDLLSAYGAFELVEADDGEAAWALLEAGLRPAMCFCDVRMPRMSGIDLLQRARSAPALAGLPFVLVSSASDRETVLQAVTLGAVGYILKPLHADQARGQLDKIFRATLDKLAEEPGVTMRRLNIGAARLQAYLGAFGEQLAQAAGEFDTMLSRDRADEARLRVDALRDGCTTLGLWQAAAGLAQAGGGALDAALLAGALEGAREAVARQIRRSRAFAGHAPVPA